MNRFGADSRLGEVPHDLVGPAFRAGEHQGPLDASRLEQFCQLIGLAMVRNVPHRLIDQLGRDFDRLDVNACGVTQHRAGQLGDRRRHCRGKEEGLAAAGKLPDDAANGGEKSHVEHAVGLVENEHFRPAKVDVALLHQIDETSGRGDEHVDPLPDRATWADCPTPP